MKLKVNRDDLLKALLLVLGAIERRQTMPILSNVLLVARDHRLLITATDLEIELITEISLVEMADPDQITVDARKLLDICRTLPSGILINMLSTNNRLIIISNKSRFNLATLSADDFPNIGSEFKKRFEFSVSQSVFKTLIENIYFSMAQDDVRYYLNGALFELNQGVIRLVSTDGHRLASAVSVLDESLMGPQIKQLKETVIIPRKTIMELKRLLINDESLLNISLGAGHICITSPSFKFISKLLEGKFPEYSQVIPKVGDKIAILDRCQLRQSLARVSILSNEIHRGVRLSFDSLLKISANNPAQEEAKEELILNYQGDPLEIGFNVNYLIDVCDGLVASEQIKITMSDANRGVLIENTDNDAVVHVIMPMRL